MKTKITSGILTVIVMLLSTVTAFAQTKNEAVQAFSLEIRYIFAGFGALCLLIGIITAIVHLIMIASHANHPIQRRHSIENLFKSLITVALLGAIDVIAAILYYTAWY